MGKILDFFSSGKRDASIDQPSLNIPLSAARPTRCWCGEPSVAATNEIDAHELGERFRFGFCPNCFESFRCWLTSRKLIFHDQQAA